MKKIIKAITGLMLSLIACILFFSCGKKPSADFTMDKTEYSPGETIKLTNNSKDAKSYKWTLLNGETSTAEQLNYTIPETTPAGAYPINLDAKRGRASSGFSKIFSVTPAQATLTIWTSALFADEIEVQINNISYGYIEQRYAAAPQSCSATGCLTVVLGTGYYTIWGTDGNNNWFGSVTISKGGCMLYELQ